MHNAITAQFASFDASGYQVGIVVSQFNQPITDALLASAQAKLQNYAVPTDQITIIKVAGSVELPLQLQHLAKSGQYQCLVALGAVIEGETKHFDYVCKIVSDGILRVQLDFDIPIGFGVITCQTEAQAQARLDWGASATEAALQAAHSLTQT